MRPAESAVSGAWHGSWAWHLITERLHDAGHDVVAVDLRSSGPDATSLGGFDDDVAVVRTALDALRASPIVVGHSYGGQVISAATAGRSDIAGLVYVCAFMLDNGTRDPQRRDEPVRQPGRCVRAGRDRTGQRFAAKAAFLFVNALTYWDAGMLERSSPDEPATGGPLWSRRRA